MRVLFPIRLHAALQRITEALVQNWQNKKMARHTNKEHKETQENKDGTYCKGHSKGETKNDRYKDCQLKKTQTE